MLERFLDVPQLPFGFRRIGAGTRLFAGGAGGGSASSLALGRRITAIGGLILDSFYARHARPPFRGSCKDTAGRLGHETARRNPFLRADAELSQPADEVAAVGARAALVGAPE